MDLSKEKATSIIDSIIELYINVKTRDPEEV